MRKVQNVPLIMGGDGFPEGQIIVRGEAIIPTKNHEKIKELPKWLEQMKKTMDFWPFAYYPFYMKKDVTGLGVEDKYDDADINADWEYIREITNKANEDGFAMFMGYEWQGAGKDGDHNVFFKNNDGYMAYPLRYEELVKNYEGQDVIGITRPFTLIS